MKIYLILLLLLIFNSFCEDISKKNIYKLEDFSINYLKLGCSTLWNYLEHFEIFEYYSTFDGDDDLSLNIMFYESPSQNINVTLFYYYSNYQITKENISSLIKPNKDDLSGSIYSEKVNSGLNNSPVELIFNQTSSEKLKKGYYYLLPMCREINYDVDIVYYETYIQVHNTRNNQINLNFNFNNTLPFMVNINSNLIFKLETQDILNMHINSFIYDNNNNNFNGNLFLYVNSTEIGPIYTQEYNNKELSFFHEYKNHLKYYIKFVNQLDNKDGKIYQYLVFRHEKELIKEIETSTTYNITSIGIDTFIYYFDNSNLEVGDQVILRIFEENYFPFIYYKEIDSNETEYIKSKINDIDYIELYPNKYKTYETESKFNYFYTYIKQSNSKSVLINIKTKTFIYNKYNLPNYSFDLIKRKKLETTIDDKIFLAKNELEYYYLNLDFYKNINQNIILFTNSYNGMLIFDCAINNNTDNSEKEYIPVNHRMNFYFIDFDDLRNINEYSFFINNLNDNNDKIFQIKFIPKNIELKLVYDSPTKNSKIVYNFDNANKKDIYIFLSSTVFYTKSNGNGIYIKSNKGDLNIEYINLENTVFSYDDISFFYSNDNEFINGSFNLKYPQILGLKSIIHIKKLSDIINFSLIRKYYYIETNDRARFLDINEKYVFEVSSKAKYKAMLDSDLFDIINNKFNYEIEVIFGENKNITLNRSKKYAEEEITSYDNYITVTNKGNIPSYIKIEGGNREDDIGLTDEIVKFIIMIAFIILIIFLFCLCVYLWIFIKKKKRQNLFILNNDNNIEGGLIDQNSSKKLNDNNIGEDLIKQKPSKKLNLNNEENLTKQKPSKKVKFKV